MSLVGLHQGSDVFTQIFDVQRFGQLLTQLFHHSRTLWTLAFGETLVVVDRIVPVHVFVHSFIHRGLGKDRDWRLRLLLHRFNRAIKRSQAPKTIRTPPKNTIRITAISKPDNDRR